MPASAGRSSALTLAPKPGGGQDSRRVSQKHDPRRGLELAKDKPPEVDPSAGPADETRPFGVYVHFPFCGQRCPYCDFAIDVRPAVPHERYAQAVCAELRARAAWFGTAKLVSLYFGGGTPGLWRSDCVGQVIRTVTELFGGSPNTLEISLEANPGEVSGDHLRALRDEGVNRLSFGVQSFDGRLLEAIGRAHSHQQALDAVPLARTAGFHNVACDLMFGLPGQTMATWESSLKMLAEIEPDHASCYALTVEPFTPFGQLEKKGLLQRPDDDAAADMFQSAQAHLGAAGYSHYEVSSYARPGKQAVHNGLYWSQGSYLGVGCAAASFRPLRAGGGWRFTNPRATETYLRAAETQDGALAPAQVEWRSPQDLEIEALWLGLRTKGGVDRRLHSQVFGPDPLSTPKRQRAAEALQAAGWLHVDAHRLAPTALGMLFADEIATRFWDEETT